MFCSALSPRWACRKGGTFFFFPPAERDGLLPFTGQKASFFSSSFLGMLEFSFFFSPILSGSLACFLCRWVPFFFFFFPVLSMGNFLFFSPFLGLPSGSGLRDTKGELGFFLPFSLLAWAVGFDLSPSARRDPFSRSAGYFFWTPPLNRGFFLLGPVSLCDFLYGTPF